MRIYQRNDSHLVGVRSNIRSVLPDGESAWKLILCVHKELHRNDRMNSEAADFSVDTGT